MKNYHSFCLFFGGCCGLRLFVLCCFRLHRPCDWCDWRSICMLDDRLDARCVRRFQTIKADEALERMKLEQ